jgi:type VI secretion system protein ImpH
MNDFPGSKPIYEWDFFQALRVLDCQHPDLPRIGTSRKASEEPIRLGQDCSMAFAPSAMTSFTPTNQDQCPRLGVAFLGLLGPNGPLPLHLTDHALERKRRFKDETFLRFLNLFEHRFLAFFYRAWCRSQPAVSYDRPEEDRFGEYIASLAGLGLRSLSSRDEMHDNAKLHFAGLLVDGAKHPEGLAAILQGYFGVPAAVVEFVGEWLEIAPDEQCRLGSSIMTGTLGENTIVGSAVFECQHRFRLRLGPLSFVELEGLLPGQPTTAALRATVRNYVGDQYRWDLQLILKRDEIPQTQLGAATARLGWTTWLGIWTSPHDADDVIVDP